MKNIISTTFLLFAFEIFGQVGINTTTPNAQLDIQSSSQVAPSNTDGILIPKIDVFPATNPTAAQQGMLLYLTTATTFLGNPKPIGFYYWNNAPADWIAVGNGNTNSWKTSGNSGTNPATNFIGTTDNTDLVFRRFNTLSGRISSSNTFFGRLSGNVSTANNNTYIGTEAGRDNVTGQQNVFIGRRSGTFGTTGSDNIFIGNGAGIFNEANQNCFLGSFSGNGTTTGANNSFYGNSTGVANETGSQNAFFGANSGAANTIGIGNTIIGTNANVAANNLTNATAIGFNATVGASNSMVLGSINGVNSATATVNVGIGTATPLDRLHVVGNLRMEDGNQAAGKVLTSDANGTGIWTTPGAGTAGTLDQSYDFGGAGNGKTITADTGAVLIGGTDGLVSTGTVGTGAVAPSGAGPRMVWNPRKAAFRAGNVSGTQWDDIDIGQSSVAFGSNNIAFGINSAAFGSNNTAFGSNSAVFGSGNITNGGSAMAVGNINTVNGFAAVAFGSNNGANGTNSSAFGKGITAPSFGETAVGIGCTTYTVSTNGETQFRAANALDRLFVVGNAIDSNNNNIVDAAERSDALVILKNGNLGIGSSTPQERLHVAGSAFFTNGFSADNAALVYRNNTDYMFLGPQSGSSANGAAMALFGTTNTSGGNSGGVDFNVPTGEVRMNHTNGNFIFGANSTSGYNANFEINDIGLQIGHNSASRAVVFRTASTERMRLTAAGDFGIGTTIPAEKLHVSGPAGLTAVRIGNTSAIGATSNVALDFFRNTGINTDWRIYNIGANLTIGNSADDLATVNDLYQFQGARFMPMNDGTQNLGQAANRWNTLFASNGTISTSDAREKKNIQNLNYGLKELLQLRPVSFEWKKEDGSGTKLGLIAQELQQVVPEVVRDWDWAEDEQGNRSKVPASILGVYYSDLIPVLIKSIQDQQQIINQQSNELEQLRAQLVSQNNRILERLENLESKNK